MHEHNHHTYKPVLIGEILKDGQFKIISRTKGLVEPEPWSEVHEPGQGLRLGQAPGYVPEEGLMTRLLAVVASWRGSPLRPASHAQSPPTSRKALADLASTTRTSARRRSPCSAAPAIRSGSSSSPRSATATCTRARKGKDAEVVVGGAKSTKGDQEVIEIASRLRRARRWARCRWPASTEIAADRRLRIAIKPFLDADETRVQLASPDPEARRGAAVKLGHQADGRRGAGGRGGDQEGGRSPACATRWRRRWR